MERIGFLRKIANRNKVADDKEAITLVTDESIQTKKETAFKRISDLQQQVRTRPCTRQSLLLGRDPFGDPSRVSDESLKAPTVSRGGSGLPRWIGTPGSSREKLSPGSKP